MLAAELQNVSHPIAAVLDVAGEAVTRYARAA
jgi:hypothetical protein